MNWAQWFANGRERVERTHRTSQIIRAGMFGAVLAGAAGWGMYSDTMHQLNGTPSTATLLEHVKECTIEYQPVGQGTHKKAMACDSAELFQRLFGADRVRISKDHFARIRFSLSGDRIHEATVSESKLGSFDLPVGASMAVVYAPDHPADVRAVLTLDAFKYPLLLFAGGLVFLMLAFAGPIAALRAWALRFRRSDAGNGPAPRPTFGARR